MTQAKENYCHHKIVQLIFVEIHICPTEETLIHFEPLNSDNWGQDYKRFSSMSRCSTHNLCSEMT